MRYLSVCSGIEAATVAWRPLGWECAGLSEIDAFPRAVLQQRLGATPVGWDHRYAPGSNILPLFGDFTQIQEHHVGPVRLLTGGTPCQSFSIAGKRLGLDDPRGNLAIEFLALAKRLQAPWIVWENVPGVLSSWSGEAPSEDDMATEWGGIEHDETGDFHAFLDLFRECGYRGCYRVLDAQYVRVDGFPHAVPQRRRRVFVVGHLGNDSRAIPVLFDPSGMRRDPPPRREPGQGITHDIAACLTGSGRGVERAGETRGQHPVIAQRHAFGGNNTSGPIDVATACRAHAGNHYDFESETFIGESITFPAFMSGTAEVSEHDTSNSLQARNPTAVAYAIQERAISGNPATGPDGAGVREDGAAYTLEARHTPQAVAFQTRIARNGRGQPEVEVCPTLNGAESGETSDSRPCVAFTVSQNSNGFAWESDVSASLQTREPNPEANTFSGVAEKWRVRRLTPRECERLQGFPDDWTLIVYGSRNAVDSETLAYWQRTYPDLTADDATKLASDGPRYKSIGNSQAVNAMRLIGRRIQAIEAHFGA